MQTKTVAYLYVNKKTGERMSAVKPWKRDGTEKWPRTWIEIKLVPADGEPELPEPSEAAK